MGVAGTQCRDDGSGSRGAYDVMMPRYGSVAALIRVSPAGDIPNGDVSDGGFTLLDAWLRVDAPNGETVRWGGTANFRVYTNLASDRYTIEISYNNGQNWDRLAESAPSGSTFVVPKTNQTNNGFAQVRATSPPCRRSGHSGRCVSCTDLPIVSRTLGSVTGSSRRGSLEAFSFWASNQVAGRIGHRWAS